MGGKAPASLAGYLLNRALVPRARKNGVDRQRFSAHTSLRENQKLRTYSSKLAQFLVSRASSGQKITAGLPRFFARAALVLLPDDFAVLSD